MAAVTFTLLFDILAGIFSTPLNRKQFFFKNKSKMIVVVDGG